MADLTLFIAFILLFLAGMLVLRVGLFNLSGEKLQRFLAKITNRPWKGFLAGIFFTGILQSSAAVMVMTVGLVSAKILTFPQTIGIILGTNIGSTFIAEFMTFSLGQWIVPGVIVGSLLWFIPKTITKSTGTVLIGISAIFAAMSGFKLLAAPLASYPALQDWLILMNNQLIYALLTGILLTALIQSSTATIGISMGFIISGDLSVTTAITIMLGSNIGTCITSWLASLGSGREATLTSYAHIWLNVFGVLAFLPFIHTLEASAAYFTSSKEIQLAHASVIFNIVTSLVVLPFSKIYSNLILKIHNKNV